MFDFSSSALISLSSFSSCAHFNLWFCNVNFTLSGSVLDTGALTCAGVDSLFYLAFMELFAEVWYLEQAVQTESSMSHTKSEHPWDLQLPLCANCCPPSSSSVESIGIT